MARGGRPGSESERPIFLALWVKDLAASATFTRDLLGVGPHAGFNEPVGDPRIGGEHDACSWRDGASFHFAWFPARPDDPATTGVERSFSSADVDAKHDALVAKGVEVCMGAHLGGRAVADGPVPEPRRQHRRVHRARRRDPLAALRREASWSPIPWRG